MTALIASEQRKSDFYANTRTVPINLSIVTDREYIDKNLMSFRKGRQVFEVLRILRKEVIQPQVPLRLPCYDLVPIAELTLGACLLCLRRDSG